MNDFIKQAYRICPLFAGLKDDEIEKLITTSKSRIQHYDKNQMVFDQYDLPEFMFVLLNGKVTAGRIYSDGRESIVTTFSQPGDIFGEVLLFLDKKHYDFFARSAEAADVLAIPRAFFTDENGNNNNLQHHLITNTMMVFANKAYFLQRRVQILSLNSLRKRIAKTLLFESENSSRPLKMPREAMAGYVNAARPSVSRELSAMERDGLIRIEDNKIYIRSREALEEISG